MPAETALTVSPELCARAQAILKALKDAGLSIVTAESCTAGLITAVLSRADGASEVLHGGLVTYTKAHKTSALGVSADVLRDKGAVNEEVVTQLARGALKHSLASLSLAVSGVLGPQEDEDSNPVGLVYFCCVRSGGPPVVAKEEFGEKTPEELLQLTIARAFDLIEECEVSGDCFSNLGQQRQCRAMTTLAAHVQAASFPINIFQRKAGDFASPQTEPRKQQQYCVIPAAHSALTVAACQNSPHVIRLN